MNCPQCGRPMEEGTMHTQKYPFWTQQELRFFRGPTDVVELGPHGDRYHQYVYPGPVSPFPHTMLCRTGGLVTFPVNLIEKSKKDMK